MHLSLAGWVCTAECCAQANANEIWKRKKRTANLAKKNKAYRFHSTISNANPLKCFKPLSDSILPPSLNLNLAHCSCLGQVFVCARTPALKVALKTPYALLMQNSYRELLNNCLLQNLHRIYKLKAGIQSEWMPMTLTSFIYIWQKLHCSWRWNAELNNCSDVSSKTAITKAELPCVRSYFYLLYLKPLSSCTVPVLPNQITLDSKGIISASAIEILWYIGREHAFLCFSQTQTMCGTFCTLFLFALNLFFKRSHLLSIKFLIFIYFLKVFILPFPLKQVMLPLSMSYQITPLV